MKINTIEYVVGFLFSKGHGSVLLIKKTKPPWQVGYLNGIGGKVEPGESSIQAMIRECYEEAGLAVTDWRKFCTLHTEVDGQIPGTPGAIVYFFCAEVGPKYLLMAESETDEKLEIHQPKHLPLNIINNLSWMIPMAMAKSEVESMVTETGVHHEDI